MTVQSKDKDVLRILTCGSVDDGKSTLIGRLLYDSGRVLEDELLNLESASKSHGTTGDDMDLALLVDGLEAEREQGITIDVAYRFFETGQRKFIIADTPGHVQYTRNMVTGASTADLAVLLVDARKGLLEQTRRHASIISLLGVKHVVLAINKMDLMEYSEDVYRNIRQNFEEFSEALEFETVEFIPMSARYGDNVTNKTDVASWYKGPCLLEHLNNIEIKKEEGDKPFRMPVQWVNRPDSVFRGFCGTVTAGILRKGSSVCVLPSRKNSVVQDIIVANSEASDIESINEAVAGDAITVVLDNEIDISRGDVLCSLEDEPTVTDQFSANIIWLSETPLYAGRPYLIKINSNTIKGEITAIKHKVNVEKPEEVSVKTVEMNEIAFCNIATNTPIVMDPYEENNAMGAFIIIDRMTNETVGAGMIKFSLFRANNIPIEKLDINKEMHSKLKGQKPFVLWFTGLSGSGKSSIANLVEKKLYALGHHTYVLDGDNVRHGLNRDLGFASADRVENIRRIGEVAKLMVDAGLITLVSFISPFRSERQQVRSILEKDEFIEIFVDTPLDVCQQRDVKGLYKKALSGEIKNFTGISSPYEAPLNPELRLLTTEKTPEELADDVIEHLKSKLI